MNDCICLDGFNEMFGTTAAEGLDSGELGVTVSKGADAEEDVDLCDTFFPLLSERGENSETKVETVDLMDTFFANLSELCSSEVNGFEVGT